MTTNVCERIKELELICQNIESKINNHNGYGSLSKLKALLIFTRETMKLNMLLLRKLHPDLYRQMTLVRQ